jgi:hypothetical protein
MMLPFKRRRAYARVATTDQTLALQRDVLKPAGCAYLADAILGD